MRSGSPTSGPCTRAVRSGPGCCTASPASPRSCSCSRMVDTAVVGWGPEAYNRVVSVYHNWVVKLLELGLVAAVLYHAINGEDHGLRLLARDDAAHEGIALASTIIFVLSMIPVTHHGQGHPRRRGGPLMAVEAPERSARHLEVARPASEVANGRIGGFELWSWLFMRISGLVLLVLAVGHVLIMHVGRRGGPRGLRLRRCAVAEPVLANLGLGAAGARADPRDQRVAHHRPGLRSVARRPVRHRHGLLVIGFGLFVLGSVVVFTFDASQWPGAV